MNWKFLFGFISNLIDNISLFSGRFSSLVMIALVLNVAVVVVLRYVFSVGFIWMQELYIWFHATVFLLGACYTLLDDEHVRIDIVYRSLTKRRQALVNCFGVLVFAFPVIHLIYTKSLPLIRRSWSVLEGSVEAGGLPGVFLFKSLIALFAILLGLQLLSLFFKNMIVIFSPQSRADR